MKRRILFVDDEPQLLDGLRRMFRSMRKTWEMDFASGPQEALTILEGAEFDVVVSDVRMPGMNGVELLTLVKERYPHTVRIILSGQSSEKVTLSAIGPVHQYLAKPCNPDVLQDTISRACALGDLLQDEGLKQLVSQVESIPTLPDLYLELEDALQNSEDSIDKVATIVSKDMGMTAQILKLVNSAFFGTPKHISDPIQGVLFLGIDTLKTLVLTVQIFHKLAPPVSKGFNMESFWNHSLATGECARKIMIFEKADSHMIEETLTAALLHDIGVLLLASQLPDPYQEILAISQNQGIRLEEAERQTLGASHGEIGAYLLGLWGLTTPIVEAIAFHHDPKKSQCHEFSPLTAVHVANVLVSESGHVLQNTIQQPKIDKEYLEHMGLGTKVDTWREFVQVPV